MDIVMMSVPHTGTNFTGNIFRNAGWAVLGLHDRPERENNLFHAHIMKETQIGPSLEKGLPIICPLRHPYWVEESWKRRGKDIGLLVHCFEQLIERYTDAHIFVVDGPDTEIDRLSQFVGEELRTDWKPVASRENTHSLRLDELSPSDRIIDLAQDQFFLNIYGKQR